MVGGRSRGLVGEKELGLMKRSAFWENTARAGLVSEEALLGSCGRGG